MINFQCPECKKKIKAPDPAAGRRVPCPGCNAKIVVPMADATASDDLKLQPDPLLDALGMDAPAPKDPYGKAFDAFESEPTPPSPPSPPAPPSANPYSTYSAPVQTAPSVSLAFELPDNRRYWALGIIRIALLVIAALVALGWLIASVIMVIGMFAVANPNQVGAAAGVGFGYVFVTFVSAAITCCMLVASSELIKLAMDIQQNTLAAAHYARRS